MGSGMRSLYRGSKLLILLASPQNLYSQFSEHAGAFDCFRKVYSKYTLPYNKYKHPNLETASRQLPDSELVGLLIQLPIEAHRVCIQKDTRSLACPDGDGQLAQQRRVSSS